MRLLFVADGRSPIAQNWIQAAIEQGNEVHLASTFPCQPIIGLASLHNIPVAFSSLKAGGQRIGARSGHLWGAPLVGFRTAFRQWLGPLTLPRAAQKLRSVVDLVQPDLVHAMRIPYEGMLAALVRPPVPLLVSIWGNDFTLHAPSNPLMKRYTCLTMQAADALHADCYRDLRLSRAWGFPSARPGVVLPGGGGVQMDQFYPPEPGSGKGTGLRNRTDLPIVINPRGFRAYVRNDSFFQAIPLVLKKQPAARFLCTGMAGESQVLGWLAELEIADAVDLLPSQPRSHMAGLFRQAQVVVSPTTHDGTPNTLLEALACGCFPVVGDLESLREWIVPGVNGLLVDPADPQSLASAILLGLERPELRLQAAKYNSLQVSERAAYEQVRQKAQQFYLILVQGQAKKNLPEHAPAG